MTVNTAAHPAQKTFLSSLVIYVLETAGATEAAAAAKAGVGTPRLKVKKRDAKAGIANYSLLIFLKEKYILYITFPKVFSIDLLMTDFFYGVPDTKWLSMTS